MRQLLINSAIALGMALTSAPLVPNMAAAQVEFRVDRDGAQVRVREDCNPRYRECRERMRRNDRHHGDRRECTPERALRKADKMGIRRARVVDVDRRSIEVAGRDRRGQRTFIRFGRGDRSCPVWG